MPENITGGTFKPVAYDFIREAFERIGIEEEGRSHDDWRSALRSLQLLQTQFATQKIYLPTVEERTLDVPESGKTIDSDDADIITLKEDVIDIISLAIKVEGSDVIMRRMSYEDYTRVPFKDSFKERSYIYLMERTSPPQIRLYYKPDMEYTLTGFFEIRPTDVDKLSDDVQTAPRWHEAFCAGMAFRLAQKFQPERVQETKLLFDEAYAQAKKADNTRNPVRFRVPRIM